jgi:hypothetical protein
MALTKEITFVGASPRSDNVIISENTVTIFEDGKAIASNQHLIYLKPDMDIDTIENPQCKALARALWTDEVKSAWTAFQEAQALPE